MKKMKFSLSLLIFLLAFASCNAVTSNDSLHTTDNLKDYTDYIPIEINEDILQTCYDYADKMNWIIKDKNKYKSGLLGNDYKKYVNVGDDETKVEMLDENDYLIWFQEMRLVIDADTGIVLGVIPYV